MTPEEKAQEILSNYSFVEYDQNNGVKIHNDTLHAAKKQCAIICVEQILQVLNSPPIKSGNENHMLWKSQVDYYQQVMEHLKLNK